MESSRYFVALFMLFQDLLADITFQESSRYEFPINSQEPGTYIGTIHAKSTVNDEVLYYITSAFQEVITISNNGSRVVKQKQYENVEFAIDKFSGNITVKDLSASYRSIYKLNGYATDGNSNASIFFSLYVSDQQSIEYYVEIQEGDYQQMTFILQLGEYTSNKTAVTYRLHQELFGITQFTLNSTTGKLFIQNAVDREVVKQITLTVLVEGNITIETSITVIMTIIDVNDNKPMFKNISYSGEILESSLNGIFVMRVNATDRDEGTNSELIYQLKGVNNNSLPFLINNNGEIMVAGTLDREKQDRYDMQVIAKEKYTMERYEENVNVTIIILDENDNNPIFINTTLELTIMENNIVPFYITSVHAIDKDSGKNADIRYKLVISDTNVNDKVFIDPINGSIIITKSLDREEESKFNFLIRATDQAESGYKRSSMLPVSIVVQDENDNAPTFTQDIHQINIREDISVGSIVLQLFAFDGDEGLYGMFVYKLLLSHDKFVPFDVDQQSGEVRVTVALDRELEDHYEFQVIATDGGNRNSTCNITITVLDVNDNQPFFLSSTLFFLLENQTGATEIQAEAVDYDDGLAGTVVYDLIEQTNNDSHFKINHTTGQLYLKKKLDYETQQEHQVKIVARDLDPNNPKSTEQEIVIVVGDVNDNPPYFSQSHATVDISRTIIKDYVIYSAIAHDDDVLIIYKQSRYSMQNTTDLFTINSLGGNIRLAKSLRNKNLTSINITVEATNVEPPFYSTVMVLTVNLIKVHSNAPVFHNEAYKAHVKENEVVGTFVIDLNASLTNYDEASFYYDFYADTEAFTINHQTGVITTKEVLDYEAPPYLLVVMVSLRNHTSNNIAPVSIEIINVNDHAPVIKEFDEIIGMRDFTPDGSLITTIKANDGDGDEETLRYYVNSTLFKMSETTGELRLIKSYTSVPGFSYIALQITCKDNNGETPSFIDTKLMKVFIIRETDIANMILALDESYLRSNINEFERLLRNFTNIHVNIYQVSKAKISETHDQMLKVEVYGINVTTNAVLNKRQLSRLLNASHSHSEDYFSGWNITNIETYASSELLVNPDTDKERTLLIGAIIGISVLLLVLVILTAHFWIRTGRKKKLQQSSIILEQSMPARITQKADSDFSYHNQRYLTEPYESTEYFGTVDVSPVNNPHVQQETYDKSIVSYQNSQDNNEKTPVSYANSGTLRMKADIFLTKEEERYCDEVIKDLDEVLRKKFENDNESEVSVSVVLDNDAMYENINTKEGSVSSPVWMRKMNNDLCVYSPCYQDEIPNGDEPKNGESFADKQKEGESFDDKQKEGDDSSEEQLNTNKKDNNMTEDEKVDNISKSNVANENEIIQDVSLRDDTIFKERNVNEISYDETTDRT